MLKSIDKYFEGKSTQVYGLFIILTVFVLMIGILDYFTGSELSFSFIYILPIMLAVWYGGQRIGLIISFVSIATWLLAELSIGQDYSHPLILAWNTLIRLALFLLVVRLLLSMRDKVTTLSSLASVDPLTGLFNRRYFLEQLDRERARVRRYPEIFTVAYIDLDNFKYVNDTHGHAMGDDLLQVIGSTIQENLRESDICARLGGDEFVVFFPALGDESAIQVMQDLHQELLRVMNEYSWPVTFSVGMVTYKKPMNNIREMVHKADELMYKVKKSGKNNILHIVWPPEEGAEEELAPRSFSPTA
jgi:diguanylate cyclase (GGDEF)-like protein